MARKIMPELTPDQREQSFEEVETGFDNADAIAEAARCLECCCQANTNCDLRDYSTECKATQTHPEYKIDIASNESWQAIRAEEAKVGSTRQKFAVDSSSEFIIFDANRCISCGQCIQACREQNVHGVLSFMNQADGKPASRPECRPNFGANQTLMGDSNCVQCGSCIQACPTGAMVDARDIKQGDTDVLKKVDTICTYCGVGCKLTMHIDEAKNKIRYIEDLVLTS